MLAVSADRQNADEGQEPGAPMRVVAQLLSERGFDVRRRKLAREESRHLTVTDAGGARCEMHVDDGDGITWEYVPSARGSADPAEISGVVRRILDADKTPPADLDTRLRLMDTLKGAVACEMNARGLKAVLDVYEDRERYHVVAEVVLTNPARPERGAVRIADDGVIRWEYDYEELPVSLTVIADTTADVLVSPLPCEGGAI